MMRNFEKYMEVFLKQSCEFLKKDNPNTLELNMLGKVCRIGDRRLKVRVNSGRRMMDLMNYI